MKSLTESAVRARARTRGYRVIKSRQQEHSDNRGLYMLVDRFNYVVLGVRYDASLEEISWFLDFEDEED